MKQDYCVFLSKRRLNGRRFPFVGLVLAAMAGILVEEFFQWPSWSLMLGFLATLAGWAILRPWRLVTLFIAVALFFGIVHAWQWKESPAQQLASLINNSNSTVVAKGIVSSEVKCVAKNHLSFLIKVEQLEWSSRTFKPDVTMLVHWEGIEPHCGDFVSLRATAASPSPPNNPGEFNKALWLARQEIATELKMDPSEPGIIVSTGCGFFLKRWSLKWKEQAEKLLESGIEGDPSVVGIIKGIVLGVKENEMALADFKLTGTMHLFAVSGLHVGMVVMMIWFFLNLLHLPRMASVAITLLFLFCYVMITGMHIGSLRAGVMAAIVLIGFLLERRPQILNNLAAAAFLLLLVDTNLLFSMGWQFSFSVVLAIVVLVPLLEHQLKKYFERDPFLPKSLITSWQEHWQHLAKHAAQLVGVSIAAWVGALVPTAYYFHQISFSALGANLLAVPLTFIIMLTALLAIGSGLVTSLGATIFNNANFVFVKMLMIVVHGFALLPCGSYSIALPVSVDPRITIFDFQDARAIVLQSEGKTWAIDAGRSINAARTLAPFLEKEGVRQLTGLMLTQSDIGSAGGASLLLEKWKPPIVVVPNIGRSPQLRHFIELCGRMHHEVTPFSQRLDFSKNCWGEFLAPFNDAPFAFKLQWNRGSFLSIPTPAVADWLLHEDPSAFLSADVLCLSWRPMNLLQCESLLAKVKPGIFIIPGAFSKQAMLCQQEQEMLQRYHVTLFTQEEVGAVTIDAVPGGQILMARGWKGHQAKTFFQCKSGQVLEN